MQSLYTSSPFSDPINLSQQPVQNSGPLSYNSVASQGPNISLISRTMDQHQILTLVVSVVLGTLLLVIILLSAVYAKRFVRSRVCIPCCRRLHPRPRIRSYCLCPSSPTTLAQTCMQTDFGRAALAIYVLFFPLFA